MIVKIIDDAGHDKHLIEAERFRWNDGGKILDCFSNLEDHTPTKIRVAHGDRVYFMNATGQTIDSKRVILNLEKEE